MTRKFFSALFLIVSFMVGLGAFGHGSQWWKHISPSLGPVITDPAMLNLLFAVWLFVSGCMVVFGLLLLWAWRRLRSGDRSAAVVPVAVGVLYLAFGIPAALWVAPFFTLFIVLGVALLASTPFVVPTPRA